MSVAEQGAAGRTTPSGGRDHPRRRHPSTLALFAVVLVPLVVAYVVLRNAAWVYDDNLILVLARSQGFTLSWLDHQIFQHWDVGMNAVYSGLLHVFPLDYRWALGSLLILLGGAIFTFARTVELLAGRSWATFAVTAWFGFSVLWIRPLQWWADGIQAIPTLLCDLVCLYAMLRFCEDGRRRWVALSAGALAAGLLFYEKPALMPVYLALMRVLLMSDRLAARPVGRTFWHERTLWLSYLLVLAVWGAGYLHSGALSSSGSGTVSASEYLHYFWILWAYTLWPALSGFILPFAHLSAIQIAATVALQVVVVALIVVSVRRRRSAWRAWAFLALTVLLDGGLVARSRVAQFGEGIGNDLRYLMDFGWLVPLALYSAFSADGILRPHSHRPRSAAAGSRSWARPMAITSVVLLAAYAVGSVATATHLQATWGSQQSRTWEANVERSLGDLNRRYGHVVVADQTVPFQIISYPFAPLNRLSRVLPLYVHDPQVDGPLETPLVRIDAAGVARVASAGPAVGDGGVLGLLRRRDLTTTGVRARLRGGALCLSAGAAGGAIERRLRATAGVTPGPYYAVLRYSSAMPAGLPLFDDSGSGYAGSTGAPMFVTPSARASIGWLDAGLPRRLKLTLPPHASLCLQRLDVITLRAG